MWFCNHVRLVVGCIWYGDVVRLVVRFGWIDNIVGFDNVMGLVIGRMMTKLSGVGQ